MSVSLRTLFRSVALRCLSIGKNIDDSAGWIRFPYYHHVFDDERAGFERQLRYLKNFGEFVSQDAAVSLIQSGEKLDGRYFCLSFDDGFRSCFTHALPIIDELGIPATFFVVTSFVGRTLEPGSGEAGAVFGQNMARHGLEFMTWDDCRSMIAAGMAIGSHTVSHPHLGQLSETSVREELYVSKTVIERETGQICHHFCVPYGAPGIDVGKREKTLTAEIGYQSLSTGTRGPNYVGGSVFGLQRDHLLANWPEHQLTYFFSRP